MPTPQDAREHSMLITSLHKSNHQRPLETSLYVCEKGLTRSRGIALNLTINLWVLKQHFFPSVLQLSSSILLHPTTVPMVMRWAPLVGLVMQSQMSAGLSYFYALLWYKEHTYTSLNQTALLCFCIWVQIEMQQLGLQQKIFSLSVHGLSY